MKTIAALVYLGAGLKNPKSQIDKIAPTEVIIVLRARDVARRVWGATLLAVHVASTGAAQYVPGRERNKDP